MTLPQLAVRNSGYGGRGYAIPATPGDPFKSVKADGGYVKTRLREDESALIVPSVTTVLKAGASEALTQWAVDQTAGYASINAESLLTRTPDAAFGYLRFFWKREPKPLAEGYDLRNYHEGVLQEAADLGTDIHEWIQADAHPGLEYPDISQLNDQFFEMVGVWDEWSAGQFIQPVLTEATVYNSKEGYAGTLDCLWWINGKLCLIDIKSARSLWPDHSRQLAALKEADILLVQGDDGEWMELPWQAWVEQVDWFGFMHVRPSDIDKDGEPMLPYLEMVEAEDLDLHFEAFRGLLSVKQADLAVKARQATRKKEVK